MKHLFTLLIAIFAIQVCTFAQIAVCENPCAAANPETDEFTTSSIPYNPTTMPVLTVGVPVDECITILFPEEISVGTISISPDSADINNFLGLPTGLSCCLSDTMAKPNQLYTLHITGTPTAAGTFALKIKTQLYGSNFMISIANSLTNAESGYSTGISITVEETATESVTANFTTSSNSIFAGNTVTYTNTSTNYDHVAWTFEGGEPSTSTSTSTVTVTYATAGEYTASLFAYNEDESESDSTNAIITVAEIPAIICETACPATTDQPFSETAVPFYAPEELSYQVNSEVDVCVTIKCPVTTTVTIYVQATANVTDITISEFTNIPEGLSYCVSNVYMAPEGDSQYCTLHITGTPTAIGEYNLNLVGTVNGSITSPISYTLDDQSITLASDIIINITEDPTALLASFTTSATEIETGNTVTFTNTSANYDHVAWTFEGGEPSTSTSTSTVTVTYATAGEYTASLIAYNEDESESDSNSVTITVSDPTPVIVADFTANQTTVNVNDTVFFTNLSQNASAYRWSFDSNNVLAFSTEENPFHVYTTAGVYTVALTAANSMLEIYTGGVVETKENYITVVDEVSADENAINEVTIYPNPATSVLNIQAEGLQNVTIIDMLGRVVLSQNANTNNVSIDINNIAKSNYVVKVSTTNGVTIKNVVIAE